MVKILNFASLINAFDVSMCVHVPARGRVCLYVSLSHTVSLSIFIYISLSRSLTLSLSLALLLSLSRSLTLSLSLYLSPSLSLSLSLLSLSPFLSMFLPHTLSVISSLFLTISKCLYRCLYFSTPTHSVVQVLIFTLIISPCNYILFGLLSYLICYTI